MPTTKPRPVAPTISPDAEDQPQVPDRFRVTDESSANWVVKHVVAARQYQQRIKEWADKELRRAQNEETFFLLRFENELSQWARSQVAKTKGKRKSINLPAGTIGFRNQGPKLVIDDEATVIQWAKQNCAEAVTVIERLSKTALNDLFSESGVVPDEGAHLEPAQERFFVR